MNDNSDNQYSAPQGANPAGVLSRAEIRREHREERRALRSGAGAIIGGLFLIGIGIVIFLQNQGFNLWFDHWQALFILLPAAGAFGHAWRVYQAEHHLTSPARASMIIGLVLCLVTAAILFDLNWNLLGPGLLVLVGAGILLNNLLPK